jgi:hypothetical protein
LRTDGRIIVDLLPAAVVDIVCLRAPLLEGY